VNLDGENMKMLIAGTKKLLIKKMLQTNKHVKKTKITYGDKTNLDPTSG